MEKSKIITIILAGLLMLSLGFALFSKNNALKNIKKLTDEINYKVDTLTIIRSKYDSLSAKYDDVYAQLNSTNSKLKEFKTQMDSIAHSRIRDLSTINQALGDLIDENEGAIQIDTTKTEFRFQ